MPRAAPPAARHTERPRSLTREGRSVMYPGPHPAIRRTRRRFAKRSSVVVTVAALGALASSPVAAHASGQLSLNCSARTVQVAIADPGPADQSLWGQLCYRGQHEPSTVQVLIPGATYNHLY